METESYTTHDSHIRRRETFVRNNDLLLHLRQKAVTINSPSAGQVGVKHAHKKTQTIIGGICFDVAYRTYVAKVEQDVTKRVFTLLNQTSADNIPSICESLKSVRGVTGYNHLNSIVRFIMSKLIDERQFQSMYLRLLERLTDEGDLWVVARPLAERPAAERPAAERPNPGNPGGLGNPGGVGGVGGPQCGNKVGLRGLLFELVQSEFENVIRPNSVDQWGDSVGDSFGGRAGDRVGDRVGSESPTQTPSPTPTGTNLSRELAVSVLVANSARMGFFIDPLPFVHRIIGQCMLVRHSEKEVGQLCHNDGLELMNAVLSAYGDQDLRLFYLGNLFRLNKQYPDSISIRFSIIFEIEIEKYPADRVQRCSGSGSRWSELLQHLGWKPPSSLGCAPTADKANTANKAESAKTNKADSANIANKADSECQQPTAVDEVTTELDFGEIESISFIYREFFDNQDNDYDDLCRCIDRYFARTGASSFAGKNHRPKYVANALALSLCDFSQSQLQQILAGLDIGRMWEIVFGADHLTDWDNPTPPELLSQIRTQSWGDDYPKLNRVLDALDPAWEKLS